MTLKEYLIEHWRSTGLVKDARLLDAFRTVPREQFVLSEYKDKAYEDIPLPIVEGQTISQPTTVMLMLKALELKETDVVLEVGTGSGYNAALIAKLASKVYSIEFFEPLVAFAKKNLKKCGITNVTVIHGDGGKGYPPGAPYDKIIITAACPTVPRPLFSQLKEGGILVAPIGSLLMQEIFVYRKKGRKTEKTSLGYFQFVPLQGKYGSGND